jgi:mRNA-degrading endonuclease YafQ of YafQ-DinJ toxin-antitoxin module
MRRVFFASRFEKKHKVFHARHPEFSTTVEAIVIAIATDPHPPALKTHRLHGALANCFASRLSREYRIVFVLTTRHPSKNSEHFFHPRNAASQCHEHQDQKDNADYDGGTIAPSPAERPNRQDRKRHRQQYREQDDGERHGTPLPATLNAWAIH